MSRKDTVLLGAALAAMNQSKEKPEAALLDLIFRASHTWSQRAGAKAGSTFTDDVKVHRYGPKGEFVSTGVGPVEVFAHTLHDAIEDFHFTILDFVSSGTLASGKVGYRWELSGKWTKELLGVPGTGKQIKIPGHSIAHVKDGKICEAWLMTDFVTVPEFNPAMDALASLS